MNTPLDYKIVTEAIESMALGDFSQATIRDIQSLSKVLEEKTGQPIIHLEMGVPGLQPSDIALKAEQEALAKGCATIYPPNGGIPRIKNAASQFVKAFIGVDIDPLCCIPTTGSMQGTFATFTAWYRAMPEKDTVLFIHPGFPVQTTQCDVIGLKHIGLDIHGYRGDALIAKLDEILSAGNICGIVYSNPNNPSWVCFNEEELEGLGKLADKHDVIILEDLAYFPPRPVTSFRSTVPSDSGTLHRELHSCHLRLESILLCGTAHRRHLHQQQALSSCISCA